jgi:hypothetical protein
MGLYLVGNSDRESGFGMGGGTKIGRPVETHTRTDQQMMQGTPAAPNLPNELQQQIDSLSEQEKNEAKEALMQIMKIVEQMMAEGATEQEIEEFLKQIGMTLEELEMAEEMFGMGEGALGFTI